MDHTELLIYEDLYAAIGAMTPEQRQQRVQFAGSTLSDDIVRLQPVYAVGTVGEFEFSDSRGAYHWSHDECAVVLLGDGHPFGDNGEVAYDLVTGEPEYAEEAKHV